HVAKWQVLIETELIGVGREYIAILAAQGEHEADDDYPGARSRSLVSIDDYPPQDAMDSYERDRVKAENSKRAMQAGFTDAIVNATVKRVPTFAPAAARHGGTTGFGATTPYEILASVSAAATQLTIVDCDEILADIDQKHDFNGRGTIAVTLAKCTTVIILAQELRLPVDQGRNIMGWVRQLWHLPPELDPVNSIRDALNEYLRTKPFGQFDWSSMTSDDWVDFQAVMLPADEQRVSALANASASARGYGNVPERAQAVDELANAFSAKENVMAAFLARAATAPNLGGDASSFAPSAMTGVSAQTMEDAIARMDAATSRLEQANQAAAALATSGVGGGVFTGYPFTAANQPTTLNEGGKCPHCGKVPAGSHVKPTTAETVKACYWNPHSDADKYGRRPKGICKRMVEIGKLQQGEVWRKFYFVGHVPSFA
ncbi:hypothetical protein THAOC_06378, partial [Thalassiosira oceanica]